MIDMIRVGQTRNLLRASSSLLEMWPRSAHHHPGQRRQSAARTGLTKVRTRSHVQKIRNSLQTERHPQKQFRRGRDFAAWLGLVPRQHSTGGKQKLGKTSKMGQRDIRRLLVIGATAVIRWASRRGAPKGSWLARMLERKPIPVVAVALANKMARGIWAMLTRGEDYRGPVLIGA